MNQYYLRDRYYGTDIGRFTQRDRFDGDMMQPLSLNRYGYTHGNPINGTDPTGMFVITEFAAINRIISTLSAQVAFNYSSTISSANQVNDLIQAFNIQLEYIVTNRIPNEDEIKRRKIKIPILVWGLDYGVTSIHTDKALHGQSYTSPPNVSVSSKMNYYSAGNRRQWYDNFAPCKYRSNYPNESLVCDEFPYNSTSQGGRLNFTLGGVSIAFTPSAEQSTNQGQPRGQGGALNIFYRDAIQYKDNTSFLVFSNLNIASSYYLVLDGNSVKRGDISSTLYGGRTQQSFEAEYSRLNKYP